MELSDDYTHNNPKLIYILESIRTKEVEDAITHEFSGCKCGKTCDSSCLCRQRSGAYYSLSDHPELSSYSLIITNANKPMYECNNNCTCKTTCCGNKLVQFGPRKDLKVAHTTKGLGLLTKNKINKGNFVCEYAGEVIDQKEAQSRYQNYSELNLDHNYIFCVNETFGERNEKTYIDPTSYGNIGRYINHSCQPNCVLVPIRTSDEVPQLCIFANEDICENTELTFDYGENRDCLGTKPCMCLAKNCRKYLPFDGTI